MLKPIDSVAVRVSDHLVPSTVIHDGHLYTWGRGFLENSDARCPVHLPTSFRFTNAALGWNHALLLTGDGEALMLGHHRVLGNPDKISSVKHLEDSKEGVLEVVPGLEGEKVVHIAAGAEHSVLNGLVKTWGWGEHGQLGLGDTCDQTSPQTVNLGQEVPNEAAKIKVYSGSGFTIAVRTPTVLSQT
uniref:Uncharacterized protein n=2 Tax=Ficus carica TaxID=3494 RepID=A0AA88EJZ0_FICCA|nr:hypothetical protein TIFTF001_055872 [Ficus carica]GMN70769.1 hypothetical protein TIFTF001_055874 [Ficus carica]